MHKPKKVLNSKVVYKNAFYQIRKDEYIRANNKPGRYYSIIADPFVAMCALTKNKKGIYLVKSWRYPLGRYIWEVPKGWRDKNETPLMAAKRELAEEVGVTAKKWKGLGWFYLAPGITNQKGYVYVAERLEAIKNFNQDDEIVTIKAFSIGALKKMMRDHKFLDAGSIVAVQRLLDYLKK